MRLDIELTLNRVKEDRVSFRHLFYEQWSRCSRLQVSPSWLLLAIVPKESSHKTDYVKLEKTHIIKYNMKFSIIIVKREQVQLTKLKIKQFYKF